MPSLSVFVERGGPQLASVFRLPYYPGRFSKDYRVQDVHTPTIKERVLQDPPDDNFENFTILVAAIRQGNKVAEDYFCRKFYPVVKMIIRRHVKDPCQVEELTQDTLITTLKKLRATGLDDPEGLPGYILGAAKNLFENFTFLVAAIRQGNKVAEDYFCRKFYPVVKMIIRRHVKDPYQVEDLTQDTLITTLKKLRATGLDDPEGLPGYIHGVAKNLCIGDARRTARRQTDADSDFLDDVADHADNQAEEVARKDASEKVRHVLNMMKNRRDRKILWMYYVEQKDKEEICKKLGLSLRHFDRVISRARKRFHDLLKKMGLDPSDLE